MHWKLDTKLKITRDVINSPNLVDRFTEEDLVTIGARVHDGYSWDEHSRRSWMDRMSAGMDLAMQVQTAKSFPWPGCANVIFPLVTIAALQFSARSYPNLIQGSKVVKYRVIDGGAAPKKVHERAARIGRHMSWQVLEEDQSWEDQHDRMLINLAIVGCNFIKTYYDATEKHPVDELVMARDLVINYWAKSVEKAPRKTQIIAKTQNEIYEKIMQDVYKDVRKENWFCSPPSTEPMSYEADQRAGVSPPPQPDWGTPFKVLEQHTYLDLDDDGYNEPYTITIDKESKCVLRIVSRFEEQDVQRRADEILAIRSTEYYTKHSFIPSPDGGIYDLGFGIFLGPINEAVNSGINQLLDNGTMQNSMGGFLGRGAKIRGGVYTQAPWEWKRVDATGDDLRKSLVPYPDRQPSAVMFQLISLLINYANRISGTVDALVGENPGQNTPASTFQGMQEQGMQVYVVIFKRVWRSMKEEFKKRYALNKVFLPDVKRFGEGSDFVRREDYTGNPDQVRPVANPQVTSTTMKRQQIMALKQDAMVTPGYDIPALTKMYIESWDVEEVDFVYPGPDKVPPLPNPKADAEKLKLQAKQMDLQHSKMQFVMQLMEDRRLNDAKILALRAQALKLATDAGVADKEAKHELLVGVIEALTEHGAMVNDRIKTLMAESSDEQESDSDGGGVPGMEGGPDDADLSSGGAGEVAAGADGAVGGGEVSE